MTEVPVVLINLANIIRAGTDRRVYILDDVPAVYDAEAVYIISPQPSSILMRKMIGGQSFLDYQITIYEVCHVEDANRQMYADANVLQSYNKESCMVYKILNGLSNIATANIYSCSFGTTTWVVNTKIYTAYNVTVNIKDIDC